MSDTVTTQHPADAELLIAPTCPHCPAVLESLGKLLKEGLIGRLTVTNIAVHPAAAQAAGTRSVPWLRLGPFELSGAHSPAELREWAAYAASGTGMGAYLSYLLQQQQLDRTVALIKHDPELLHALLPLLADLHTPMGVRIGIGAVFEELQDSGLLATVVAELGALTRAIESQVRADACHYLGLTGTAAAAPYVRPLLDDTDAEVREIAGETLPLLTSD
jgi:hypothetical protein